MTTSPAFTRRRRLPAAPTRLACALVATSSLVLTACSGGSALSAGMLAPTATVRINLTIRDTGPTPAPTLTPLPTPILPTPEPTVSPIVARVNGQDISREAFNQELHRYLTADPSIPAPDSPEGQELAARLKDTVLEAMIEQAVIEQEAAAIGTAVTDAQVDQEFNALIQLRGGRDKLDAWLAASNQTEQEVREWVRRDLVVNAMRDRIVAQLPRTAEYVHAYHIVVASETEAQTILAKLNNGGKFNALAKAFSIDDSTRPDGGDLGWFTPGTGTVLWSEVEDAAFALAPGQISPIVASPIGYHVIKVVERQTRALTPEDASFFQQQALQGWLAGLIEKARIEKYP